MLLFIAGMLAGAFMAVVIIGFVAVVTEDKELEETAEKKHGQDEKDMNDIEDWYTSYY